MPPYTLVSVPKKSVNQGRPTPKKKYVMIFDWDDVADYARDEKNVRVTTLEFKEGKNPIGVFATSRTINPYSESSGESGQAGFLQHVDFEHPGTDLEFDEFIENNINRELGAIVIPCDGVDARIAGTPCIPLVMTVSSQDNNEAGKHTVQLVSEMIGSVLGHISKELIPETDNVDINAALGLPYVPSEGDGEGEGV